MNSADVEDTSMMERSLHPFSEPLRVWNFCSAPTIEHENKQRLIRHQALPATTDKPRCTWLHSPLTAEPLKDRSPSNLRTLPSNFVSWGANRAEKQTFSPSASSQLLTVPKFNYQNREGNPGLNSTLWKTVCSERGYPRTHLLPHDPRAHSPELLHLASDPQQKAQVHAQCSDVGPSFTAHPENT